MGLTDVRSYAKSLMKEHGLSGWKFNFNHAKIKVGMCAYDSKVIYISKHYAKKYSGEELRDVILHEISHALVGVGHGHGPVWKRKCMQIGCDPSRTTSKFKGPDGKYTYTCPNGHMFSFHRQIKTKRSCALCSPKFNEAYLIVRC